MSVILPDDKPVIEKPADNPRSLKNFIPRLAEEVIELIPRKFNQGLTDEQKDDLKQRVNSVYIEIPQHETLDLLETSKDPKELAEESFKLIDRDGVKMALSIKRGKLSQKGLRAFTDLALFSIAMQIINVSLGHPDVRSNYSPLLAEAIFIHNLMQKKRLTQKSPNEEIKFNETEIGQLAESLTNSLIDVRGLIAKMESKINTGQYL